MHSCRGRKSGPTLCLSQKERKEKRKLLDRAWRIGVEPRKALGIASYEGYTIQTRQAIELVIGGRQW